MEEIEIVAEMEKKEKHFVVVHGACHGAWCWYKVVTLLKSSGHKVTTLDLAACGTHPNQYHQVPSAANYIEPLMEFMASLPPEERVILVGHSLGGLSISVAMERFPQKVSVAVFCTAFMPSPDLSLTTLFEEDLTLAVSLVRPHPMLTAVEWNKVAAVTKEKYGSVDSVYIVCDQDNILKQDLQRWMIQKYPTKDVKLISGSDHMLMFSKPKEFCCCLQEIIDKYT
ncbi:hypothetical protein Patl1_28784 [Pistacia atlantica]|uniref:Uncharacterized protein n=1 Tax=Pistacia atlantica TaxID=434234 RepID=A0ACC1BE36_9ROSI|nr:hypothetical protein Patl1_28784 [Pistacia atlantica]